MSDTVQRDIGRMEAQIANLCNEVHGLRTEVANIKTTLDEAKGGWRTLMWLSGISATVGGGIVALVVKFFPIFGGLPK